ncbi:FG-GAP repeat domain-containing protein [Deinococcus humi]|uniref:VCBS repeat-containing protein n=1 Tax=Deinococcus humi TaxID=662880 RepID=A0A7W8JZQ9_9DEIO|nr:VCBS repeat-containing protein [Deinococcus humi]MBB5364599.1 hypothetical protein [Deinococcus humi]GGO41328.1 hypothetical protein GCM10008949_52030 [Deinococcus humi]
MLKRTRSLLLLPVLLLSACSSPSSVVGTVPPPLTVPVSGPSRSLGLFEITFIGGGTQPLSVTARPAGIQGQSLTDQPAVSLALLARANFDQAGNRNYQATFGVTNTSGTALTNLTFLAVSTPRTIAGTPVSTFQKFDGTAADPAIATQLKPSQPKILDGTNPLINQRLALFQAYTEAEVSTSTLSHPAGVSDIFPYGFVTAIPGSGSRTLPAESATGQVTFSFDLPLQSSAQANPFKVSIMVEAYTDSIPTVTQGPDELGTADTASVQARISTLQAQFPGTPVLLKSVGCPAGGSPVAQRLSSLRTAGTADAPTAMLGNTTPLLSLLGLSANPAAAAGFLDPETSFEPSFDQPLASAGGFAVRGLQSGPLTNASSGPALKGTRPLFAGEEVEQVLSSDLTGQTNGGHLCAPVVSRFRVRTKAESAAGFQGQVAYGVGSTPYSIALADIDGDGRLDLVTANSGANTVSVLLGQSGGTFAPQVTYGVGAGPVSVALGDVNSDGRLDLVTANSGGNNVSVLLGQSGGTFAPQVKFYRVGNYPYSVALGDVNGDGRVDLVTTNVNDSTVSVLLAQSGGTFAPQVTYGVGSSPESVVLGDLNGDGRLDLVTPNYAGNTVSVLLGQSEGTFAPQVTYGVGSNPASVALGDLNGDGRLDLVTANYGANTVSVLLGQSGGTFAPQVTYGVGSRPISVALGDVNGDSRLDLATANANGNTVSVLAGQSGGTFASQVMYGVGSTPFSIAQGDVNGDGRLDLATASYTGNTISILTKN